MEICVGEFGRDYEFKELSSETVEALRSFDQDQWHAGSEKP